MDKIIAISIAVVVLVGLVIGVWYFNKSDLSQQELETQKITQEASKR